MFERAQLNYKDMFEQEVTTYESNIAYTLRFMIDTKVTIAWGDDMVVVAFRGTASARNAATDIKVGLVLCPSSSMSWLSFG